MRSSEVSGAGALGFRAGQLKAKEKRVTRFGNRSVALTAFAAAALFIAYDTNMMLAESRDVIGALVEAELASPELSPNVANASMMAAAQSAGALAPAPDASVLAEIAGHSAIALGLAGLASFFAARRRRDEVSEDENAPVGSYETL